MEEPLNENESNSLEAQQEQNRNKEIKKIEAIVQMRIRAIRLRFVLIIIFFLGLTVFLLSFWLPLIGTFGGLLILGFSLWHLKYENDFIRHLSKKYGVK